MLGIDDPMIWTAYLLCILSTLFCVGYGVINWNKGDDVVYPEDETWADEERKVEEDI